MYSQLSVNVNLKKKEMRDNKTLLYFQKKLEKQYKEMTLFRNLKKEVETGANGTQDYIIKKGINKDKKAEKV
mgnify:FL=1|jgi:hypothetical protein|tara:strand:+ start:183 stop:398 length:216 start_codon:yes stop_codon:yes gene_type:complete